ncbi:hypothetical protein [Candidatus Paracaedibacter symbiosus]|uniref:hypothetical protein n=1 Tax=Candidatus Paracaedibacter symbiosus TaxID=244582 RepID=UPI001E331D25|nr:hypothetical protein [Candidatus Paracaedibacter symbiosus]
MKEIWINLVLQNPSKPIPEKKIIPGKTPKAEIEADAERRFFYVLQLRGKW